MLNSSFWAGQKTSKISTDRKIVMFSVHRIVRTKNATRCNPLKIAARVPKAQWPTTGCNDPKTKFHEKICIFQNHSWCLLHSKRREWPPKAWDNYVCSMNEGIGLTEVSAVSPVNEVNESNGIEKKLAQSFHPSIKQSINKSRNPSIHQSNNPSINQSLSLVLIK